MIAGIVVGAAIHAWVGAVIAALVVGGLAGRLSTQGALGSDATDSRTDELTRLLNLRGFGDLLEIEVERARRTEQSLSLLMVDLDHLTDVNDRFGREVGDECLMRCAGVITAAKRRIDIAARIGGEELALILPDTDEHGAYVAAERLRVKVSKAFEGAAVAPTVSVGIATFPVHANTPERLLVAAGRAVEAAKVLGRDRSVIHSAEIDAAAPALDHGAENRRTRLAALLALAGTVDVRDNGNPTHSNAVSRYAAMIAREFCLPPERVERVRLAGILHDVGMVEVPRAILEKAGPLSEEEWEAVKTHSAIGSDLLEGAGLEDVCAWVLAHHERPDGRGYPRGLRGDQIPLEAKILAVADAYEAMTARRVYRPALRRGGARVELMRLAGTRFDGRVVEAFLRCLDRETHAGVPACDLTKSSAL